MKLSIEGLPEDVISFCDLLKLEWRFNAVGKCALFFTPDVLVDGSKLARLTRWDTPDNVIGELRRRTWDIFEAVHAGRLDL